MKSSISNKIFSSLKATWVNVSYQIMIYQRLQYNPIHRNKIIGFCCLRTGYLSEIYGSVTIWFWKRSFYLTIKISDSSLWCSGIIIICVQVILYFRPNIPNGSSNFNHTSNNVSSHSPIFINGQFGSDQTSLVPIAGNNFTVICDKVFTQDDLIRVTFFTPKSFIGWGWVGLVPASIVHGNESLNWHHSYAHFKIEGELN